MLVVDLTVIGMFFVIKRMQRRRDGTVRRVLDRTADKGGYMDDTVEDTLPVHLERRQLIFYC